MSNLKTHAYRGLNILISLSILLGACKSKKSLVSDNNNRVSEIKLDPVTQKINRFEMALDSQMLNFKYLSLKVHTDYKTANESTSVKAQIRIKKDSLIWISVTPLLGIEVARILIRPDSVFILNRIQGQVARYGTEELRLRTGYPMSLPVLQNLILGHPLVPLSQLQTPIFTEDSSRNTIDAKLLNNSESYQYKIVLNKTPDVVEQFFSHPAKALQAKLQYLDFTNIPASENKSIRVPKTHDYNIFFKENIYIHNEYSKIETQVCEFPFSIPARYESVRY